MPYRSLSPLVRRQPWGRVRYNYLLENQVELRDLFLREHLSNGRHNALRIPREVMLVRYSGGAYSLVEQTWVSANHPKRIASISSPGVGRTTLTLESASFTDAAGVSVVAKPAAGGATGPSILNWNVASATSVEICNWRGAAWALTDASYYVALYAKPVTETVAPISTQPLSPGDAPTATRVNELAANSVANRVLVYREHHTGTATAFDTGNHRAREFATVICRVANSGVSYTPSNQHAPPGAPSIVTSATRVSAGIIDVAVTATDGVNSNPNPSTPIFVEAQGAAGERWVEVVDDTSHTQAGSLLTGFRVHLWKHSSTNTWTLTDGSFWFAIYSHTSQGV